MITSLKQEVVKGAVWTLLEKLSIQIVGFVAGIILARLLSPTDNGTVVMTSILFAVAGTLIDIGHGKVCERRTLQSPVACKEWFEVRSDANVISPRECSARQGVIWYNNGRFVARQW